MIREWRISRFKSISGTEILPFRPLTILAGANSSGKSSVIQSILLIGQSLASQVPDRQLVLNGELVKLGTFDDVHNQQASEQSIRFGFVVDLDLAQRRVAAPTRTETLFYPQLFRTVSPDAADIRISGDITFGPASEQIVEGVTRPLQADVISASFKTLVSGRQKTLLPAGPERDAQPDVIIMRRTDEELDKVLASVGLNEASQDIAALRQTLRYGVTFSDHALKSLHQGRVDLFGPETVGHVIAVRLQHFLPAGVMWEQRELHRTASTAIRRLYSSPPTDHVATLEAWRSSSNPIWRALATAITDTATERGGNISQFIRTLRGPRADLKQSKTLGARVEAMLEEPLRSAMIAAPGPLPEEQDLAFQGLHNFFGDIKYLGPLRDDPKPLYSMSGAIDPMEVGSKGQYTAAVLDVNSRAQIEFVPPGETKPVSESLGEALRSWLQHFAMADGIRTIDEGKLGHRLLVRPTGIGSEVDLTNVGVGVSQVLPIIVMSLVSAPGSVLLFEQPELHLHPAVQSQLADFFIALSRSGRQCVVETHSEYLINRLRLRIAESDPSDDLKDQVVIHFVERTEADSRFRPVHVNAFGAIPDWPKGFFDQGPNESELILRAAMKKKSIIASRRETQS